MTTETSLPWPTHLPDLPGWPLDKIAERFSAAHHGDFPRWRNAIDALPELRAPGLQVSDRVVLDGETDMAALRDALEALRPWRKGPFEVAGLHIDTEWRSDWKWQRIRPGIASLQDHRVLDVGCGNGYFGWRMLADGAREVIGIDPTLLFCMQHQAIQRYARDPRNWVLPLRIEEVPQGAVFDSVFSMGVIYHRRDPQAHVDHLASLARAGGQVVLESLIVEGDTGLAPPDRYARMRNVWYLPSVGDMLAWMQDAGLVNVRCIDVTPTGTDEQRSTHWMPFESLREALDAADPGQTVEGLPAPVRATVVGDIPD